MKRIIATLLFFTVLTVEGAGAVSHPQSEIYQNEEYGSYRKELREYREFEKELDRFSYAMLTNNRRVARLAKYQLLKDMEREIQQTRRKLAVYSQSSRSTRYSKREPDWRTPRLESKANGLEQHGRISTKALAALIHRREQQERLYKRFRELSLVHPRRGIINEDEHRRIVYRFKDTMKEALLENAK